MTTYYQKVANPFNFLMYFASVYRLKLLLSRFGRYLKAIFPAEKILTNPDGVRYGSRDMSYFAIGGCEAAV